MITPDDTDGYAWLAVLTQHEFLHAYVARTKAAQPPQPHEYVASDYVINALLLDPH